MGSAGFTIPTAFTAIDKFSGVMKGMGNAVQGFVGRSERLLGRANLAFSKLMTPITSLNRMLMGLGFYVGLFTLIRVLKNAVDIVADFQQANADLSVVMGLSVKQNKILADDARRIGLAYGVSATEVVRMQHALATLGFEQDQILKMGRPLITGSAALEGANPERLAETVGAVINAFDNLEAKDTQHILDVMTLAANRTALNFEKLATTLPLVSKPASLLGISFEKTVSLLGQLASAGVHVATSGTALKNIFIDSSKKGHTYDQLIQNIIKSEDKLTFTHKKVGKKSFVSALVLAANISAAAKLEKDLVDLKNNEGLTSIIAAQRLDTFRGAQKLLNAAYQEFILSIEDGNGPLAQSLTRILKIAHAMLLLSTDSLAAVEALGKVNMSTIKSAKSWLFWINIIKWAIGFMIAMKILLIAWAFWLDILKVKIWLVAFATKAWAAATFILDAAMAANPIGLIIIAIAALIALVLAAVAAYNDWGAAVLYLLGPIGWLINLVQAFRRNWDMIVKSFKDGGIISGLKAIGAVILDSILMPFQQIAKIVSKLTGAEWASDAVKSIEAFRAKLGVNTTTDESGKLLTPAINPKAIDQENRSQNVSGSIRMDINDPGNNVKSVRSDSSFIMPRVTPTNSFE